MSLVRTPYEAGFNRMTSDIPSGHEGHPADLLAEAEAHYEDALEAVRALKARLAEGAEPPSAEISRIAQDYRRATQTLFDERKRLDDQRKREAGVVHDYALDLDAARAEIGRKLDRLRAARGSAGVSGGADGA